MAGRDFGSFDSATFRNEASADPFKNFISNGMQAGPAKSGMTMTGMNPDAMKSLMQMFQSGKVPPQLIQLIVALLGGKK